MSWYMENSKFILDYKYILVGFFRGLHLYMENVLPRGLIRTQTITISLN